MQQLILVVLALPFLAALVVQVFAARLGRRAAAVSVAFGWLTILSAAVTLWLAISGAPVAEFMLLQDWGIIRFDPLSALMALVIAAISLIVHLYSVRYMV